MTYRQTVTLFRMTLLAVATGACTTACSKKTNIEQTNTTNIGLSCESADDPECATGACVAGICREECSADSDCAKGSVCLFEDEVGGCRISTEANCASDDDCPEGIVCGLDDSCRTPCPCPSGYQCIENACFDLDNPPEGSSDASACEPECPNAMAAKDAEATEPSCPNDLENDASEIVEQQVDEDAPEMTGGEIVPGTYHLTERTLYTGTGGAAGPTGISRRWTARVSEAGGGSYYFEAAESENDGSGWTADERFNMLIPRTAGSEFLPSVICPADDPQFSSVSFSATESEIQFVFEADEVSVYALQ